MARKIKDGTLETRSARLRLLIDSNPVFVKLGVGVFLGYRRNRTDGSWVVRTPARKGHYRTEILAAADDYREADGSEILTFWQAQERARKIARHNDGTGAEAAPQTVGQALDAYEDTLKTNGRDPGNASRVRHHLSEQLLALPVVKLHASQLRKWRDGLTKTTLAPSTVNRTINAFKAALTLAADNDDERIQNRSAWGKGLKSLDDAGEARNVVLSDAEILAIVAAAYRDSAEFGLFVETAAATGARESQLAHLDVLDLQDGIEPRLMMTPSKKGRQKKKRPPYPIDIRPGLAAKLRAAAAGRPPAAPLLVKPVYQPKGLPNGGRDEIIWTPERITEAEALAAPDADGNTRSRREIAELLGVSENAVIGLFWRRRQKQEPRAKRLPSPGNQRWGHSEHSRPFARAVAAAGLDPEQVTIYALRHSSITRQLLANEASHRVIAAVHDTSVTMIERNYSRYIVNHAGHLVRRALLDTDILPPPAEIIPLREHG
jgi:integrase